MKNSSVATPNKKPNPKDFGYDYKYGWPDKIKLQAYRKAMAEYQKYLFANKK